MFYIRNGCCYEAVHWNIFVCPSFYMCGSKSVRQILISRIAGSKEYAEKVSDEPKLRDIP